MLPLDPVPRPIDHLARCGVAGAAAIVDRAGTLDFAGLEALTGAIAAALRALGLETGARVASWLPKSRLGAILTLAAPRAGLIHVPINPILRRAQVAHILADSGASLLVTQEERAATLYRDDVPSGCRVSSDLVPCSQPLPPSSGSPDRLAAILYTSGSTGPPKGVMLSHANLWLGAVGVANYLDLTPSDRVLAILPLSFDYGQNQLFSTWAAGASVVPIDYLTARDVIKAVERFEASTIAGVPPLWVQLLEADWPEAIAGKLRRLTNSGGALTASMVTRLRERFPAADLVAMYGLTEAFRSTFLDPRLIDANPESIGKSVPFAEVMVVAADGSRALPGEVGELVHAGPLVAQGYWRDPERTAARFRPAPSWSASGGVAVWSGDKVSEGADGLLRFVGRDDEMIKSAGNRISPTEIEEAVLAGGEALEAVAFGVADPRLGEVVLVIARATRDPESAEAAVRNRLRAELPVFMQPSRYIWLSTLPLNANGKIDRARLKADLAS